MSTTINVEDLGKKYIINHENSESYTALRDVLTRNGKKIGQYILHPKQEKLKRSKVEAEDFWALRHINFKVSQGERLGIIGRNGAGKSTLLKLLSRITEPSEGSITLRGRVASLLEVGTGFHPELTGRENILLNGALLGMSRQEIIRKFDEIVEFAEVEKFLDTPVKRYSSGMYVRLAFAVAAHLEPEILIVDEVLAVGDLKFRTKCLGKMQEVGRSGRTVLFVSHDMSAIRQLCDRTILINKGGIMADGETSHVTDIYEKAALGNEENMPATKIRATPPSNYHFAKIEMRNSAGEPTSSFKANDIIDLHFWMSSKAPQESFTIEYILYNEMGTRISFGTANPMTNTYFGIDDQHISCKIGPLPLTSGRYHFDFSVRVWGLSRWDSWESALYFQVTRSDIFNTGYDVTGGVNGDFVLGQKWQAIKN